MGHRPPRIAVIVPTFNRAATLPDALRSVLAQTRAPDEVIVVDDGSTDATRDALAEFRNSVTIIEQANKGVAAARNAGVERSTCEWITFLDSDDLWLPSRLRTMERDLDGLNDDIVAHVADILFTGAGYSERLFAIRSCDFPEESATVIDDALPLCISGMSLIGSAIRRDAFLQAGGFDVEMPMLSDTALFCRLAVLGPFLATGDVVAEARRVEGDQVAITALRSSSPRLASEMHVRYLEALQQGGLSEAQSRLVRLHSSRALLRLASTLHADDRKKAKKLLVLAARRHPSPVKGWLRSLVPLAFGTGGYRFLLSARSLMRS